MYEVMARRYRPALFDDVVGQEHIASTLKNAITRNRVAHAFMFTGGHGCGKTTMARILAKALVCQNGPTPNPCCACPICLDVAAGRDADVLEIDGASNNGIEQIRALREQAAYVPTRARFKIYIIDEVHMLSDGAFNALLKTLEEPPAHVKFILATTDPHKVPDTILSRCQRFDFRLVPQPTLAAFFRKLAAKENAAITDDALDAVAAFAGGSVRDGLVLLDQLLSFSDTEVTRRDVESLRGAAAAESVAGIYNHIANANVAEALTIVDEVASRGTNAGDFLDQLIAFGRDLMILIAGGTGAAGGLGAYGPARDTLFALAKHTDLESALLYLDVFSAARTRVRQRALTNPLVSLEMAVARLAGLGGITPVSAILEKLDSLPQLPPSATASHPVSIPPPVGDQGVPSAKATPDSGAVHPAPVAEQGKPIPDEPQKSPTQPASEKPETPESQVSPDPEPEKNRAFPERPKDVKSEDHTSRKTENQAVGQTENHTENDAAIPSESTEPILPFEPDPPVVPSSPPEKNNSTPAAIANDQQELTTEKVKNAWSAILDRISEKHTSDIGLVMRTNFEEVDGEGQIVFSGTRTTVEAWEDSRRLARLTAAVEEVLGRPVAFRFDVRKDRREREKPATSRVRQKPDTTAGKPGKTVAEPRMGASGTEGVEPENNRGRREELESKRQLQRNLVNNPVVDSVRSLFDGVIIAHRGIEEMADSHTEADQEGETDTDTEE